MRALYLSQCISLALATNFSLLARDIDSKDHVSIGTFDYDPTTRTVSLVDAKENLSFDNKAYCIDVSFENGGPEFPCFQYMELSTPLHYDLALELHGEQLKGFSLTYNQDVDGIISQVRAPVRGPSPSAIKLKKVTKTYKDKKAGNKALTAQFEEDVEADNKTWIQKNWKRLVLGVIIYSAVSSVTSGAQKKQANQKSD